MVRRSTGIIFIFFFVGCAANPIIPTALRYNDNETYSVPMAQSVFTARFFEFKQAYGMGRISLDDYEEGLRLSRKYSTAWNASRNAVEAFENGEMNQDEAMAYMVKMTDELKGILKFIEDAKERGNRKREA